MDQRMHQGAREIQLLRQCGSHTGHTHTHAHTHRGLMYKDQAIGWSVEKMLSALVKKKKKNPSLADLLLLSLRLQER